MPLVSKLEGSWRLYKVKSEAAGRDGSEKAVERVAGDSGTVSCTSSSAAHFTLGSNVSLNKLSHSHRLAGQDVILCRLKCQSHAHCALFLFLSHCHPCSPSFHTSSSPSRQCCSTGSAEARLCRWTDGWNKRRVVRCRESEMGYREARFTAPLIYQSISATSHFPSLHRVPIFCRMLW